MHFSSLLLRLGVPGLALTAAGTLVFSAPGIGFNPSGDVLDLSQRDFRIFPNFTDPTANDNLAPDPDYPGATGAALALWKGVAEWGSALHGTGLSDPLQDDGIGSGGANFDASFQGYATAVGLPNQNIVSQLDTFGGGTLAFCETPTTDGWRIRFYRDPTEWHDGPGTIVGGPDRYDLQGVMTHEYGHALGLNHSAVSGATMAAGASGTNFGLNLRTLEADDIAGVQAIYGVASATKPRIATYELTATGIALVGEHFDATDNEVWFTRSNPGDGTPVTVGGVPSTAGGTRIEVDLPLDAGEGDVLVRVPGATHDRLSNAFPVRPDALPCVAPTTFGVGKTTSIGSTPTLRFSGIASASTGSFELHLSDAVFFGTGVLFSGPSRANTPFAGGTLYVAPPFRREANFSLEFGEASATATVGASMVGTTRYYQMWFRDPSDAFGVGLSNAIAVRICQ